MHILCYTHGEASTLNETDTDLRHAREDELCQAGIELGAASVTLLDYADGRLSRVPPAELAAHVTAAAVRTGASGLLVFDDTGITGHPDHRAGSAEPPCCTPARSLPARCCGGGCSCRVIASTFAGSCGQPWS